MRHRGFNTFQLYIEYEMKQLKDQYKVIQRNSYDIYQMIYKTRYYNGLEMSRITPHFITPSYEVDKMYSKNELLKADADPAWKNLATIVIENEVKLLKLRKKYKEYQVYDGMCMSMYINLLVLYWNEIGKILLKGYRVSLGYGLGSFGIIRKMTTGNSVDWLSSFRYKQEIMMRGLKPYNFLTGKGVKWIIRYPKSINIMLNWRCGVKLKNQNKYKYICKAIRTIYYFDKGIAQLETATPQQVWNNYNIGLIIKAYSLALKDENFKERFPLIERKIDTEELTKK